MIDGDLLEDIKEVVSGVITAKVGIEADIIDVHNRLEDEIESLEKIKKPTNKQKVFIRRAKDLKNQFKTYLNIRGINPTKYKGTTLCNTEEEPNKTEEDSEPKS